MTFTRLNAKHRYAVIEMGMNHFGEIAYLTNLTHPDIAVITNAGPSHLEGVGDLAGVARAKAEIFQGLDKNGIAILNKDDVFFETWQKEVTPHKIISFGLNNTADVTATIHPSTEKQALTIHTPEGDIDVALPLLGRHNILNALAATAAALAANIKLADIKHGLETIKAEKGRMQVHTLANGTTMIDDTYNANPSSLKAAVDTLASRQGMRILVLGDMKELGKEEKDFHRLAGEHIRTAGIDHLFTIGQLTTNTANAFGNQAQHFTEQNTLLNALKPYLKPQTTILVKGSRSMHMEVIVNGLAAAHNN